MTVPSSPAQLTGGGAATGAVSLRAAVAEDADGVASLDAECFGPSAWSATSWADEFARLTGSDGDRYILVATDGTTDRVAGYVVLIVPADVRDPVDLTRIAVASGLRRTGIGERMIAAALEAVAGRTVLLEVAEGNEAAVGLYRRAGFGELSRRRGYYGADGDALVMRRPDDATSGDATSGDATSGDATGER